jgi:hypothetical protein
MELLGESPLRKRPPNFADTLSTHPDFVRIGIGAGMISAGLLR